MMRIGARCLPWFLLLTACDQNITLSFQSLSPGSPRQPSAVQPAPPTAPSTPISPPAIPPPPILPPTIAPPVEILTYDWRYTEWTNTTCHGNNRIQTRTVVCKNNHGSVVNDPYCTQAKPISSQPIGDPSCVDSYSWATTPWTNALCSPTAGIRLQQRLVTCNNSYGVVVDDTKCLNSQKPDTTKPIGDASCVNASQRTLTINPNDNRAAVHVFFIIDNSGSMSDEQPRVLSAVNTFVKNIESQSGLKARYSVLSTTAREAVGFNTYYSGAVAGSKVQFWGGQDDGRGVLNPILPYGLGQEGILINYPQWNSLTKKYIPDAPDKEWQVKVTTLEESHAVSDFQLKYIWQQAPNNPAKTYSLNWNPRTELGPILHNNLYSPSYQDKYGSLFGFYLRKTDPVSYQTITPPDSRTTNLLGAKFGFEASWPILPPAPFERASDQSVDTLLQGISQKITSLGVNGSTDSMGRCVIAQALVGQFLNANERPLFVLISDAEDKTGPSEQQLIPQVEHDCFYSLSVSQEFVEKEVKAENKNKFTVVLYGPGIDFVFDAEYFAKNYGTREDERTTVSPTPTTLTALTDPNNQWQPAVSKNLGYPTTLPEIGVDCTAAALSLVRQYILTHYDITLPEQNLLIKNCKVHSTHSMLHLRQYFDSDTVGPNECALPSTDAASLIAKVRAQTGLIQSSADILRDTCTDEHVGFHMTELAHMWRTTVAKRVLQHELLGIPTSTYPGTLDNALKTHLRSRFGANGFGITAIYNRPNVSFCSVTGNSGVKYETFVDSFRTGTVLGEAKGWDICAGSYEGALVDLANFATGTLANTFIIPDLQPNETIVSVTLVFASGLRKPLGKDVDYIFTRAGASIKLINSNALLGGDTMEVNLKTN